MKKLFEYNEKRSDADKAYVKKNMFSSTIRAFTTSRFLPRISRWITPACPCYQAGKA